MDYKAHYDRLIERARNRVLEGYRERHHVLPRCCGGDDSPENLVDLTPEEHLVAHELLVKLNPGNGRIAHAANLMASRFGGNKKYGWLRRLHAAAVSRATKGSKKSAEHRAKIAASHVGIRVSPEAGRKIGEANRNRVFSDETRARMSASHTGVARGPCSPETRAKIASAHRARFDGAAA